MNKPSFNETTLTSVLTIIAICTTIAFFWGGTKWAIGIAIATSIGGLLNLIDEKNKSTSNKKYKNTKSSNIKPNFDQTTNEKSKTIKSAKKNILPSIEFGNIQSDTIISSAEAKKLVKQYLLDNTKMDKEEIKDFIEDFNEDMKDYNIEIRDEINNLKEESANTKQKLKEEKEKHKISKKTYTDFMKSKVDYDEEKEFEEFEKQDDKENELMIDIDDIEYEINSFNEFIEDNKNEIAALREKITAHTANKLDFTLKYIKSWEKNEREYN